MIKSISKIISPVIVWGINMYNAIVKGSNTIVYLKELIKMLHISINVIWIKEPA